MDQFCFSKKFTCDILSQSRRSNTFRQPCMNEYESKIDNKNDASSTEQTQESSKQPNSGLQDTAKTGVKKI